jgi:CRISPR-associated protein Csx14
MTYNTQPVLVCTLGGKAQVVTFTIDALLEQKVELGKVVVIHHASYREDDRLRQALTIVEREVHEHYQDKFTFQAIHIHDNKVPITDLNDTPALTAVWETLGHTISGIKNHHREIHFCFTGGRRLLAMQAMSVLSLHATLSDSVWHLSIPDLLRQQSGTNKILHATTTPKSESPHLVRVPLVPWPHFFKGLRELLAFNPEDAMKFSNMVLDQHDEALCQKVWTSLTPSLRDTLCYLVKSKSPQDVACELGINLGSVRGYIADIRQECRNAWALDPKAHVSFDWMQQKFGPYIDKLMRNTRKDNPPIG